MGLFNPDALKKALAKKEQTKTKTHTILLVDDEVHNLTTLRDLLEDDYHILIAEDGQEALELVRTHPDPQGIHLIISDQRMPRMTGVEFFQKSLEIIPKAKRILLTGFSDVNAIIDSINKGQIYKFILKPFDRHDLVTTVRRALEAHELEIRNDQLVQELSEALERQKALNQASNRFVPFDLLELLTKESISDVLLGDHVSTKMSVMFSDIRGFTTLSESMTPQENFAFVNSYLKRISPIIREHHGFIIKYLGDGMMAVFPNNAEEALNAGIAKLRMVSQYNVERKERGHAALEIGIGLNYGAMMLGMVGESNRMQGDVLSDAVNLAARLEGLTKQFGASFLVAESVIQELSDPSRYHFRALGHSLVRGKQNAVSIYEIFDADPPDLLEKKLQTRELFERGVSEFMREQYETANVTFQQILNVFPNDHASRYYHNRALEELALRAANLAEALS